MILCRRFQSAPCDKRPRCAVRLDLSVVLDEVRVRSHSQLPFKRHCLSGKMQVPLYTTVRANYDVADSNS